VLKFIDTCTQKMTVKMYHFFHVGKL